MKKEPLDEQRLGGCLTPPLSYFSAASFFAAHRAFMAAANLALPSAEMPPFFFATVFTGALDGFISRLVEGVDLLLIFAHRAL